MWKIGDYYNKIEENLLYYSLILTVSLIFIQVVMRYLFANSLSWSEEMSRYVFIWQTWMGASYATRMKRHLRIEALTDSLHGLPRRILEMIVLALWISFGSFLVYKGYQLTKMIWLRGQVSAAMEISMAFAYAAIPVGSFFMTIRLIREAYNVLTGQEEYLG